MTAEIIEAYKEATNFQGVLAVTCPLRASQKFMTC